MNKVIRSYLVHLVATSVREASPEFSELKRAAKGGGVTLRSNYKSAVQFYIVLHFVPDRDDIHLDLAWSRKGRMPSEDIWYSQAKDLRNCGESLDTLFQRDEEGWLRPEEVAPGFPSAFKLEHEHPPLDDLRELLKEPQALALREAFPTFDSKNPATLEDFGWDLLEVYGREVTQEYAAYAVGAVRQQIIELLIAHYLPLARRLAGVCDRGHP